MLQAIQDLRGKTLATLDTDTRTVYIKRGESEVALQFTDNGYTLYNGKLEPFIPKTPKR